MKTLALTLLLLTSIYADMPLQWQDNSAVIEKEYDVDEAKAYCQALSIDGYSDWRLPTIEELFSIVDVKKRAPAVVDDIEICANDYYWSSTIFVSDDYSYWSIDFTTGIVKVFSPGASLYVRCVR